MTFLVTGTYVLTESIFETYGGQTGTSTQTQRNIAFQIAEQFAIEEIGTFLVPTSYTHQFSWPIATTQNAWRFQLPHSYVTSVTSLTASHEIGCGCTTVDFTGCAYIVSPDAGIVDLQYCGDGGAASCNCAWAQGYAGGLPRLGLITYVAGHSSGIVAQNAAALQGLVLTAQLALEQLYDPAAAEGGPGDPSIETYSDKGYSEKRIHLVMTMLGGSARANYAARMLRPLKFKKALRLH